MTTILCHQAIFTSLRSVTGGGYRLVAASPGLRPEEKKYITTRCPSHQGLCSDAADAVGVCAYTLPTGRYCITHTCTAGHEYSGRGGQRVHTHILVLESQASAQFQSNPFELVRNLIKQGLTQSQEKPPETLPELQLNLEPLTDLTRLTDSVNNTWPGWIPATLDCLLAQKSTVLLGRSDALTVAEALLLSLPVALRSQISFSAGLRYSLARGFDLAVVTNQTASQLRPSLTGHAVSLLTAAGDKDKAPLPKSEWCQLVAHHWQDRTPEKLLSITVGQFHDTAPQALNGYARIVLGQRRLRSLDAAQILDLLTDHLSKPVTDELAASLAIALTKDAVARLTPSLTAATIDQIQADWSILYGLWKQADRSAGCFAQIMGNCLKRATQLDPFAAVALAAELVHAMHNQPAFALLEAPLADLLDRLADSMVNGPTQQKSAIKRHLDTLMIVPSLTERITELQALMQAAQPGPSPVAT